MRLWRTKQPYIAPDMTAEQLAEIIERFVDGTLDDRGWDDLDSVRLADSHLELVRQRCIDVDRRFPPTRNRTYCDEQGIDWLRRTAQELRAVKTTDEDAV